MKTNIKHTKKYFFFAFFLKMGVFQSLIQFNSQTMQRPQLENIRVIGHHDEICEPPTECKVSEACLCVKPIIVNII